MYLDRSDTWHLYHIGASIKDLSKKWFGFTLMRDIPASEIINRIKD